MDAKFFDSLFEGDSPDGVKFGMGLTGGDFWPRVLGCYNLYHSADGWTADGGDLVAVADPGSSSITVSDSILDQAAWQFVLLLRTVNICGCEADDLAGALRLTVDETGMIALPTVNGFLRIDVTLTSVGRARLMWLYNPVGQAGKCDVFDIYSNGGAGSIDLNEVIASVDYLGCGVYVYQCGKLIAGDHLFSVIARSSDGVELSSSEYVWIEINDECEAVTLVMSTNQI